MAPRLKKELKEWCEENSKPRREFRPAKVDRGKKLKLKKIYSDIIRLSTPGARMLVDERKKFRSFPIVISRKALKYKPSNRILEIAEPKHKYVDPCDDPDQDFSMFLVKDSALKYKATKRIKELAQHIAKMMKHCSKRNLTVSNGALKYKASKRITELSKGPKRWDRIKPCKSLQVSDAALKGHASARVAQLASPREYQDNSKKNIFEVKRSALKYKATPRINKLAEPRKVPKKYHCE